MPTRERLPGDLKALAFRSAFSLHNEHWRSDVEEMARRLKLPDDKTATGWTAALGQLLNAPVEGRYEIELRSITWLVLTIGCAATHAAFA